MNELGAGRVAAGTAVVVGWVPVHEADEQDGVNGVGNFGVAKPDGLSSFLASGSHPGRKRVEGGAVVDDDGLDEEMLALFEELAARFRGGDGRSGHEFGDLSDRIGAQGVVVNVLAHDAAR